MGRRRFVVIWLDADTIINLAKAKGWVEGDANGSILDLASPENHYSEEWFNHEGNAVAFAEARLPGDFFGQVDIEEREEEVEPMEDGPPLRSWETIRTRNVTSDGLSDWERVV